MFTLNMNKGSQANSKTRKIIFREFVDWKIQKREEERKTRMKRESITDTIKNSEWNCIDIFFKWITVDWQNQIPS